ncbi:winged helix-turn-helix transcriptional regulator [Arthrobacter echini]|uniref:Winged helix-turn-helix transcriptional regulator n=1 Tax=Arthrobacter echini TaxID=1529066 RepID=A0A4S5E177_9MICC|nr:winged helix-turn-helix domain-containing protein [Arthrobacter echini]THJ65076.1 winged helix-turn-helix transcriptional regulator [Arthrobacter echini]
MSVQQGYVHISLRSPQNRTARQRVTPAPDPAVHGGSRLHAVSSAESGPMSAPVPVVAPTGVPGPQAVTGDTSPRGFVLYVALDEATAAAAGTTFTDLAQNVRAYVRGLVPSAASHAAVALAPADAEGSDIDVVRAALGDPTVTRRQRPDPAPTQVQRATGVLIDLSRREVQLDGRTLNLTFKEFELLNYLVENAARTVGREELLSGLWRNADEVPNERTIDVHIRRLRAKLGRLANTVRTVRGQGYRFYDHPEVVVWAAPEYSI